MWDAQAGAVARVSSGAYCAPRFAGCGIPSQTAPSRSPAKYFSPVDQCKRDSPEGVGPTRLTSF